ncbi:MAG: hypothetical protein ACXWHB_03150 [Usitatibacter sp.]
MHGKSGIWIDHKEAFVVFADDAPAEPHATQSGMEKHVRYSGHAAHDGSADDQRDRQFAAHLATYYDEVISLVRDAESIFIFGPGEAKGELEKRMGAKGLAARIVGVETTDKMTGHQIAAKVRERYRS